MYKNMTIIITMAGLGTRFKKVGYKVPKYMIEAKGKTLFEWSMDSLLSYNEYVDKYIFVVRKEDDSKQFIKEKCLKYDIKNIDVVEIDYMTDGQATTCMLAMPHCNKKNSIIVYNIDTYVEPYQLKYEDLVGEGHIPCFNAEGEHWSFVKLDSNGKAIEVREKKRISNNCTLGAYYFSSAELYMKMYNEYYKGQENLENNEKYIAPLYNYMIKKDMTVTISLVEYDKVHVLGTPEELNNFIENEKIN